MNLQRYLGKDYLPAPLIATMILTHFHHFGDALHLPDASLAVFFFAGFYRNKMFLGFLLALAGLIDYVAIANGTSSWCVSPAYVFLIPTYAVMWFAGRYCTITDTVNAKQFSFSLKAMAVLASATSLAFVISNGSFYLFSGRYTDLSWMQYIARAAKYYPPYIGSTLIYGISGLALATLLQAISATQNSRKTAS